uniref:Uncharacterized protein n=1 Tax=Onchocerca volvulus TaxID=6282 RepID=A0A8R1XY39_ONCVO
MNNDPFLLKKILAVILKFATAAPHIRNEAVIFGEVNDWRNCRKKRLQPLLKLSMIVAAFLNNSEEEDNCSYYFGFIIQTVIDDIRHGLVAMMIIFLKFWRDHIGRMIISKTGSHKLQITCSTDEISKLFKENYNVFLFDT